MTKNTTKVNRDSKITKVDRINFKKAINKIRKDYKKIENWTFIYNKEQKRFYYRYSKSIKQYCYTHILDVLQILEKMRNKNILTNKQLKKLELFMNNKIEFPYEEFKEKFNIKNEKDFNNPFSLPFPLNKKNDENDLSYTFRKVKEGDKKYLKDIFYNYKDDLDKRHIFQIIKYLSYYLFDEENPFSKNNSQPSNVGCINDTLFYFIVEYWETAKKENMIDFLHDYFPKSFNYYIKNIFIKEYIKNISYSDSIKKDDNEEASFLNALLSKDYINVNNMTDKVIKIEEETETFEIEKEYDFLISLYKHYQFKEKFLERKKIINILFKNGFNLEKKIRKNLIKKIFNFKKVKEIAYKEYKWLLEIEKGNGKNKKTIKSSKTKIKNFYKIFNKLDLRTADVKYKDIQELIGKLNDNNLDKIDIYNIKDILINPNLNLKQRKEIIEYFRNKENDIINKMKKKNTHKEYNLLSLFFKEYKIEDIIKSNIGKGEKWSKKKAKNYYKELKEFGWWLWSNKDYKITIRNIRDLVKRGFMRYNITIQDNNEIKSEKDNTIIQKLIKEKFKSKEFEPEDLNDCIQDRIEDWAIKYKLLEVIILLIEDYGYSPEDFKYGGPYRKKGLMELAFETNNSSSLKMIEMLISEYEYSPYLEDYSFGDNKEDIYKKIDGLKELLKKYKKTKKSLSINKMLKKYPPKKQYRSLSKDEYVKFTEYNDHEGETWHFYINGSNNKEYIQILSSFFNYLNDNSIVIEDEYKLGKIISKEKIDILVEEDTGGGYMPRHNIKDKLDVKKLKKAIKKDLNKNVDRINGINGLDVGNRLYKGLR